MRLGFVVTRISNIKHWATLVEEALARGLDVTLFLDHTGSRSRPGGLKGYQFPVEAAVPSFRHGRPRVMPFATLDALFDALRARHVDALFGARPILPELTAAFPAGRRPLVAQVQTTWDSLMLHVQPDRLAELDVFYGFSPAWVEWWADYQAHWGRIPAAERDRWRDRLRARFVPVGFAEAEQFKYVDPAAVRARLRLPAAPIVLYLPFPFQTVWREFWPHFVHRHRQPLQALAILLSGHWRWLPYAMRGWNDPTLVRRLREFCDRSGAALVVKGRLKNRVPGHLARRASRTLYDEACYPATIVELLSVASLCVHYYSFGLVEAAYGSVPSLCISPSGEEWRKMQVQKMSVEAFSGAPDTFYNFAGVVHRLSIPEAFERLPQLGLADLRLDPARRRAFLQHFFGHEDLDVAARIFDDLERRVAHRGSEATAQA